jgi:NAD(P)-dependent dehydrogenase (short-subunit alcohol dehydrogenase family)
VAARPASAARPHDCSRRKGARAFVFGRHEAGVQQTISGVAGECHGTVADQSKQEEVERVFREADERIGGCDILINNAAVAGAEAPSINESRTSATRSTPTSSTTSPARKRRWSGRSARAAAGTSSTSREANQRPAHSRHTRLKIASRPVHCSSG